MADEMMTGIAADAEKIIDLEDFLVDLKVSKRRRTENAKDTAPQKNVDFAATKSFGKGRAAKATKALPVVPGKDKNATRSPGTEDVKSTVRSLSVAARNVPEELPWCSKSTRYQANEMEKKDGEPPMKTSKREQYKVLMLDAWDKQRQGTEIVYSLQSELDATRVALRKAETESAAKLVALESKLGTATGELFSQRLREKGDMSRIAKLQKECVELQYQKTKIERELSEMGAELEQRKASERMHARDLEQAKSAFEKVRLILVEDVTEATKKNIVLEEKIVSMEAEHNRDQATLQAALETCSKELEDERELSMCQMCSEGRKDTVCYPCLHMQFCFSCMEKQRKNGTSNKCPVCRATVTDVKLVLF